MTPVAGLESSPRRVYIIDDLLGAILLLAAGALLVLLDLTRRQLCAVYQLAFVLFMACSLFVIGGLIDVHLSNDQLQLALYSSYVSRALTTSYVYAPVFLGLSITALVLYNFSVCTCDCCCVVGAKSSGHQRCFTQRIRAHVSLYLTCFVGLYVAVGMRLNVRLRESAIHPVGGTLHWMMLRSPFYLSMIHMASLALVLLKIFLQHAERSSAHTSYHNFQETLTQSSVSMSPLAPPPAPMTASAVVEELMRPPPLHKNLPLASRRSNELKTTLTRSPHHVTKPESKAIGVGAKSSASHRVPTPNGSGRRRSEENQFDGDVSALISSDSESDDEVLQPKFSTTRRTSPAPSLGRRPSDGSSSSAVSVYTASPPPSPARSSSSTSASSTSFSTSSRPRAALPSSRPAHSRSRLSSNGSSSSTTVFSDSDEMLLVSPEQDPAQYHNDQPVTLRRRLTARRVLSPPLTTMVEPTTEWIECFDDTSGSAYYYNTRTGESRWKEGIS
ncbi:hypothetical protein Poli38472_005799 [Pythium oligandrum]|uniref:WW domain-containing protein n=1 Tax=Pythium oligandrum TaxID=41045 RepID=A0A8K1CR68_PYTOL|nr:hypothetical protein Poli38472_005799 [Pythium oligandrum]|eukprot:TMW68331.1 hypothetical protein Poli38472_005799 [Pythium oligandrum]